MAWASTSSAPSARLRCWQMAKRTKTTAGSVVAASAVWCHAGARPESAQSDVKREPCTTDSTSEQTPELEPPSTSMVK